MKSKGIIGAVIGVAATLLMALVGFMMTFSAMTQEVANLRDDVIDQTMLLRLMQDQNLKLVERVASLEAKFCVLVPGAIP